MLEDYKQDELLCSSVPVYSLKFGYRRWLVLNG